MVANPARLRWASAGRGYRQGTIRGLRLFDDQLHGLTGSQLASDDAALNRSVASIRHKTFERDDGIGSLERGGHGCGIMVGQFQ